MVGRASPKFRVKRGPGLGVGLGPREVPWFPTLEKMHRWVVALYSPARAGRRAWSRLCFSGSPQVVNKIRPEGLEKNHGKNSKICSKEFQKVCQKILKSAKIGSHWSCRFQLKLLIKSAPAACQNGRRKISKTRSKDPEKSLERVEKNRRKDQKKSPE